MKIAIASIVVLCAVLGSEAFPRPQEAKSSSYEPKSPEGYFQYVNVPGHKEYEFGHNRGNPEHYISRYEQSKDHRFRTRVRWGDKHGGYGEHYWEYNHGPSYKEPSYKPEPAYKEEPSYAPPPQPAYVA